LQSLLRQRFDVCLVHGGIVCLDLRALEQCFLVRNGNAAVVDVGNHLHVPLG
jgi:hypothetical protein